MLDKKNRTLHASHHPSLLRLRMALIAAERESHPRPSQTISDEDLASELIERMRTEYNKPLPFMCWKNVSNPNTFNLQEVIGMYA
jgi:hypothetical protein